MIISLVSNFHEGETSRYERVSNSNNEDRLKRKLHMGNL